MRCSVWTNCPRAVRSSSGFAYDVQPRRCEERSDEAIQFGAAVLDCFASLAMTESEYGIRRLRPSRSHRAKAAGFLRGPSENRRSLRPRRLLRLSYRRASFDAARHGAVAERLPRRGGAAYQAAALRSAGLRAAAVPSAAADCGNLHARPDERRTPGAEFRPRRLTHRS